MATTSIESNLYKFHREGREFQVHPERRAQAAKIDANHDAVLDDQEIMDYLIKTDALEDPTYHVVDQEKVVKEFKSHLLKEVPENALNYHTYDEVAAELARLAETHPDIAQRVSLGTSHEGREIWALKISSGAASDDTRQKPGVVITGCHHAREWMSMEAPLFVAQQLVEGYASDPAMKDRVDKAEIWVVPLVNPDGYEYSRTQDNWWRKNRRPVSNTFCDNQHPQSGMGVDLNRNYADDVPAHEWVYRPPGDTPCSTRDDFGRTSDDPDNDTYRGPFGASERETQAMLNLELGRGNIKGILDHHGYGQMILYPWGNTYDPVD
ncbi:MAG: hypothetical protein KC910_18675, partial [Candidatus Eremiobacteraeota bacterium]|nr:hypothetical protein [Candidatus Eremiobacteraeota bacterium]